MADLLADIENATVDDGTSTVTLLRKALLLASALRSDELRHWVDQELDGYRGHDEVPEYRRFGTRALGHFSGPFGSGIRNAAIPPACMPDGLRRYAETFTCMDGISNYESLLKRGPDEGSGGTFRAPWPPNLIILMQEHPIFSGMALVEAWQEIPRNVVEELVATVRTRLLRFVIDLRRSSPGLVVQTREVPKIGADAVLQSFVVNIQGGQGNIAIGSQGVTQHNVVLPGNVESLVDALRTIGVTEEDIADLEIIVAEEAPPKAGLGRRAADWVGRVTGKVMGSAVDTTAASVGAEIGRAVLTFFGAG